MKELPKCELCGTNTSGVHNDRFDEIEKRLVDSARVARDERAFVFLAKDSLSKLNEGITSSRRVLPHEDNKGDWSKSSMDGARLRYPDAEDSKARIKKAIGFLLMALDSINQQLEDDAK